MHKKSSHQFTCPKCGSISNKRFDETFWELYFYFTESTTVFDYDPGDDESCEIDDTYDIFRIEMNRCDECGFDITTVTCIRGPNRGLSAQFPPNGLENKYPDYIPFSIRQDYTEARAIADLSPKSAAVLARRCLQSIIRDFWNIKHDNLCKAINALKGTADEDIFQAMHDIRDIGNIAAHAGENIDCIIDIKPDEVKTILDVIDHVITETYIMRHNTLSRLHDTSEEKRTLKKANKKAAPPEDDADDTNSYIKKMPAARLSGYVENDKAQSQFNEAFYPKETPKF